MTTSGSDGTPRGGPTRRQLHSLLDDIKSCAAKDALQALNLGPEFEGAIDEAVGAIATRAQRSKDPIADVSESLIRLVSHQGRSYSRTQLGLLDFETPLSDLSPGGSLPATLTLALQGAAVAFAVRIDRSSDVASRYRLTIDHPPAHVELMSLLAGVTIPTSWRQPWRKQIAVPPRVRPRPASPPPTVLPVAIPRLAAHQAGRFDTGPGDAVASQDFYAEVQRSGRLFVRSRTRPGRDADVVMAEITWSDSDGHTQARTIPVNVTRNPDHPAHTLFLEGTAELPDEIGDSAVSVTVRDPVVADLPFYTPSMVMTLLAENEGFTALPLMEDGGGCRFEIRHEDQRAAVANAGRRFLVRVSQREGEVADE